MTTTVKPQVIVIAGSTGIGKTALSLKLADYYQQHHNQHIEVVSADSVQLYRRLDIGSNKVSKDVRQRVPHHLIDCVDLQRSVIGGSGHWDVSLWYDAAHHAIQQILQRGNLPVVVGGAGLYLRWLVYGKAPTPAGTAETRSAAASLVEAAEQAVANNGSSGLIVDLAKLLQLSDDDAVAYLRSVYEQGSRVRLERAVEILQLTGGHRPQQQPNPSTLQRHDLKYDYRLFYLHPASRAWQQHLVDYRCEQMIQDGLLHEVIELCTDAADSDTATRSTLKETLSALAIGYKQSLHFLDQLHKIPTDNSNARTATFNDYLSAFQAATRGYIRRQGTWFRAEPLYEFVQVETPSVRQDGRPDVSRMQLDNDQLDAVLQYVVGRCALSTAEYNEQVQSESFIVRQQQLRDSSRDLNNKTLTRLKHEPLIYTTRDKILQLLASGSPYTP